MPDNREAHSNGFTLVELIIVVGLMGMIAVVLSAVIVVIIKTSPAASTRIDDARVLQGLVTWLPQDVDSTPTTGFNVAAAKVTGCNGASAGTNLLHMTWTEKLGGTTTTYVANYRHETQGGRSRLVRITCSGTTSAPYGNPTRVVVSREIKPLGVGWAAGQLPARVTIDLDGLGDVALVRFEIESLTGKILRVDSAPKNPNETLPSTTIPTPPTTSTTTSTTTIPASTTTVSTTTTTTMPCTVLSLSTDDSNNTVNLKSTGSPGLIDKNVVVRLTWSGGCRGLYLAYNSGGSGALLTQNFSVSSPYTVKLVGHPTGVELWTLGGHALAVRDGNGGPYGSSITLTVVAKGAAS